MRSELVFVANGKISNRFMLCRLASESARRLHKPTVSIQDNLNDVFGRLGMTQSPIVPPADPDDSIGALQTVAFDQDYTG